MELNDEYYEEKKKIFKKDKRKYNKDYYNNVRKNLQKIEKCKIYCKEFTEDKTIKIIIEEGKFEIEM